MKKTIVILALAAFLPISVRAQDNAALFAETGYDAMVKAMIPAFQQSFEKTSGAPKEVSDAAAAALLAKVREPAMKQKAKACFRPQFSQTEITRCLEPWSAEVQAYIAQWLKDNKTALSQKYMTQGKLPYPQLAALTLRDIFAMMPADFPAAERDAFKKKMTAFLHSADMEKLAAPCLDLSQSPPEKLAACLKPWMEAWTAQGKGLVNEVRAKQSAATQN
ncbi:MAG: hypothetical protein PHX68_03175 [Alphaproteobacteria bacterium]|nr:hypothetical protein [Alphaproteobacteria bacterium]